MVSRNFLKNFGWFIFWFNVVLCVLNIMINNWIMLLISVATIWFVAEKLKVFYGR